MQRVIIALILIIIAVSTYLFLNKPEISTDSQTGESVQPQSTPSQQPLAETLKAAKKVIKTLTEETKDEALDIKQANNFVTGDQLLELPNMKSEAAQVETIQTAMEAADEAQTQGVQTSTLVVKQPLVSNESVKPDQMMKLISEDNVINTKTLSPGDKIRLKELLSNPDIAAGSVFYIHAVTPNDMQGLWGILQRGLTNTFREGIKLSGENGQTLIAEIPELADEVLENQRSSFLGEFLYSKVNDIYIYNYQQGMLGQDPDLIKPGQQLVIVSYSEEELIKIYQHFTRG
ncbi:MULTISPECIES: hypothetical protein [unclassified Marinobacterium]|uniref:hypothetical protein n=1 Tax=unclassified Marinobacterium TaxID=2644139 RepID=UPI00156984F0|nr:MULTISPECIES: hypothetical protein [unclassified Marinobacterium]NRP47320.1 hypothetical protein [Marinobacterium sp. xm-d-543]NRQ23578.1 hypothetical protein [Marinobacterium sp. xm-m-312]